ncbi:unnamed protein product, partial [Oppiella nova]
LHIINEAFLVNISHNIPQLQCLDISVNTISDVSLDSLSALKNLRSIRLQSRHTHSITHLIHTWIGTTIASIATTTTSVTLAVTAMAASNGTSGDQSWRTNLLRQNVRNKIEEAIRVSGNPTSKTAFEMENHIFLKARTKEDYLSFVARLILHVKEMGSRNATVGTDCQSLPNSLKRSLSPTLSLMLPMPCPPLQHPFPQPLPPMNATPPAPTPTARVWTGIMDYEEKPLQPGPSTDDPRDTHSLDCNITCRTVNGVPEVYGHEWPQQLLLSLVPKQLIMSLFPMLKSSAYHIT